MRAEFVLSEMATGLRRNLIMTVAVVVTVAISLSIVGLGLLLQSQVGQMKDFWYERVEISIFLSENVTQSQREALRSEIDAMPEVEQVFYESKEEAYQRFTEQFRESPAIVENATPASLPESFRLKLEDPKDFEVVASAFENRAGVERVVNQREMLRGFFNALNALKIVALIVAVILLVAGVLLISNTIRVAAFNRRRETGIMRLVGASNFYIQLPFLMEGAIAGLVGGIVASGLLAGFVKWVLLGPLQDAFTGIPFVGWDAYWSTVPILVLAGVALSALASFVTLRKYLRV